MVSVGLFEAGRLILTFPTNRVRAYSRWALIGGGSLFKAGHLKGGDSKLQNGCYR